MESILHGLKPEPSKQSLVNEREQSMKEPKRKALPISARFPSLLTISTTLLNEV
jgi:hypothetical protein